MLESTELEAVLEGAGWFAARSRRRPEGIGRRARSVGGEHARSQAGRASAAAAVPLFGPTLERVTVSTRPGQLQLQAAAAGDARGLRVQTSQTACIPKPLEMGKSGPCGTTFEHRRMVETRQAARPREVTRLSLPVPEVASSSPLEWQRRGLRDGGRRQRAAAPDQQPGERLQSRLAARARPAAVAQRR